MRAVSRLVAIAVALSAMSSLCSGYYYWIYFADRNAPRPVPGRFDLEGRTAYAIQNKAVSYFISDQQPFPMMPGDSFQALVSEIRLAASVWDNVATSDLRLKFGGI